MCRAAMFSAETKQKIEKHIAAMPESLRREPATEQELAAFEEMYGPITRAIQIRVTGGGEQSAPNAKGTVAAVEHGARDERPRQGHGQ
jgi:hypothetical protein